MTEKSWIDTEADAMECARNLADSLNWITGIRIRICENVTHSRDVTDDLL